MEIFFIFKNVRIEYGTGKISKKRTKEEQKKELTDFQVI